VWLEMSHVGDMQWNKGSIYYHIPPAPRGVWASGWWGEEDAGNRRGGIWQSRARRHWMGPCYVHRRCGL
jgi:hypothetical protein